MIQKIKNYVFRLNIDEKIEDIWEYIDDFDFDLSEKKLTDKEAKRLNHELIVCKNAVRRLNKLKEKYK